jgi:RNA polymerase-binding transcription factor DksA
MGKKKDKKKDKKAAKKAVKKIASKKPVAKKKVAPKKAKPAKKVASKKPVAKKVAPKKAKPVAKKVASKKPVAKKVSKPAPKKVAKPVAKKVEKPVVNKIEKPVAKKAEKPVARETTRLPRIKPEKHEQPGIMKQKDVKLGIIPDYVPEPPAIPKREVVRPAKNKQKEDTRNRYSEKELQEFKGIILEKLDQAKKDYELLKNTLCHTDDHGTEDTSPTFKMLEDGSDVLTREETAQLALRQEKFIQNLQNALIRIENKTYGICRVTGKLIPKERLRRVPHATLSIDAKLEQQFNA